MNILEKLKAVVFFAGLAAAAVLMLAVSKIVTGGDFPYAADKLIEEFANWSATRVAPFQIEMISYETQSFRRGYCTTPLVTATESHLYGLVADHCVQDRVDRKILGLYVFNRPVVLLPHHEPPNEVRIWKAENATSFRGRIMELAKTWWPGMKTFVVGVQRIKRGAHERRQDDVFVKWYTSGFVQTERGHDLWGMGDLNHSAPATFGFSGGPVFVYNMAHKRFELLALTNAVESVSLFSYAYSVSQKVFEKIEEDAAALGTASPPASPPFPPTGPQGSCCFANFESLSTEFQEAWLRWHAENKEYRFEPWDEVIVENSRIRLSPREAVLNAWLTGKLKTFGKLQEVDWSRFSAAVFGTMNER